MPVSGGYRLWMVMVVAGLTAAGAVPLAAVTLKVERPVRVGRPLSRPVMWLSDNPGGSTPLETTNAGAGAPVARNRYGP